MILKRTTNLKGSVPSKVFAAVGLFIFVGCSQNIDQVQINPRPKPPFFFFAPDVEHQGGNPQTAMSPSAILSAESLGGNFTRTNSSSPSFQMVSGIGVD